MVWIALACQGTTWTTEPPAPAPAPAPPVAPEVELLWVQASLLRLREQPNQEAAFTPLAINTRVRVVERQGDWTRILAPDGRSGWVHADFLADKVLTREHAEEQRAAATDPAQRVTWAERSAALAPGDSGALDALVAAYQGAGRAEDAARVQAFLQAEESERFDRWFAPYLQEVAAIGQELGSVGSAEALVGTWNRARQVTASMGEALLAGYDDQQRVFVDGDPRPMLAERMPWATVALYAEGTVPALELAPAVWVGAASRTPEPWDDAFFSLITTAYDNASARGWTTWQRRSWDYGGCSPFGSGENLHLALLQQTDALAGAAPVAPVVGRIRADLLRDIEKPTPDEFPYCTASGDPTPTEGLLTEAQAILDRVRLTEPERQRVEQRVAARFGRP